MTTANSCFDLYPLVEMTHIEIGCNNPSLAAITQ